jgi:CheY-like chemotaxis protein
VRLPLDTSADIPEKSVSEEGPSRGAGRRVLVVDDNTDAAEALREQLTALEAERSVWDARAVAISLKDPTVSCFHDNTKRRVVEVVHDGPAALALFESLGPNVVLLDIGLPGMDGYEVARRIRVLPNAGSVRLVAVTGWGQENDRRRALDAGFEAGGYECPSVLAWCVARRPSRTGRIRSLIGSPTVLLPRRQGTALGRTVGPPSGL